MTVKNNLGWKQRQMMAYMRRHNGTHAFRYNYDRLKVAQSLVKKGLATLSCPGISPANGKLIYQLRLTK